MKIRFLIILGVCFYFYSCQQKETESVSIDVLTCDAEQTNKSGDRLLSNTQGITLTGAKLRSKDYAHSGEYSLKMSKKERYAMGVTITDCQPEGYYEVSFWKYGPSVNVSIVATGKDQKIFYTKSRQSFETDSLGWKKITHNFFIPPNFHDKSFKVYIWNIDGSDCYVDDLTIVKKKYKTYPVFEGEALDILIDSSAMQKIKQKRHEAFNTGILESTDNDYVKVKLAYNSDTLKASVRLKGDWLDHLDGDKWSFRIKMRKDDSFKNLRTFSVQTPESRSFLREYIVHKLLEKEDVLTTRYFFIPLKINRESKGIYAVEEHFDKQLVEARNRREGPILKYSEDAFWRVLKVNNENPDQEYKIPFFAVSQILPFKEGRTVGSENLYNNFLIAQNLLFQFKYSLADIDNIFDVDKLAKYVAIVDLTRSFHGFTWHNLRFYYNPITCKLEPIAFDCNSDGFQPEGDPYFIQRALNQKTTETSNYLIQHLFENEIFLKKYVEQINKMTSKKYLDTFLEEINPDLKRYEGMITQEFDDYHLNTEYLYKSAKRLKPIVAKSIDLFKNKKNIEPELRTDYTFHEETIIYMVQAYKNKTLEIINYLKAPVKVIGYGLNDSVPEIIIDEEIPAYKDPFTFHKVNINTYKKAKYLFVQYERHTFTIEIKPWPAPSGNIPVQGFIAKHTVQTNDNKIVFKRGENNIDKTIVIPSGKKVIIQPGAKINIINNAAFISYSPVTAIGTPNNIIEIYSSDGTANSFSVLKANGKSKLSYVKFNQLNTLHKEGWSFTGAVNFYDSQVEMSHVQFTNNRSEDALNIICSSFTLDNCNFDNIFADAFDSDFSNGTLSNSKFRDIGNDAIDFSGSKVTISSCQILNAGDKGISGGENSTLQVNNCTVNNANIGIASKDLSKLEVDNTTLAFCSYGFVAFMKKPEYGPASIKATGIKLNDVINENLIEIGSELIIDNNPVTKKKKNVADEFYVK